jgi:predicted MPP superfamily phosphohydrolase
VRATRDRRWRDRFEELCESTELNLPFYAVLGNHDYRRNEKAQVEYTFEHPESRWKMPARYYSFIYELSDGTRIELFGIDTDTIETEVAQLTCLFIVPGQTGDQRVGGSFYKLIMPATGSPA